jgi:hypothetical protein
MEKSQRFSPERNNPQAVMLQKEIYRREEKILGMARVPEQIKIRQFAAEMKPKFAETKTEEIQAVDANVMRNGGSEAAFQSHRRAVSDVKFSNRISAAAGNKVLENVYRARIGAAVQLKNRYDFNNRSPITWLGKNELTASASYRQLVSPVISQEAYKNYGQLNTKRILKGMGYSKSNIFIA